MRQISRTRGQFASLVAVVAIGIAVFVLMTASYGELYDSLDRYYREYRFGDLLVEVRRAPASVVDLIRRIDGVSAAEGRLMFDARMEVPKSSADNTKQTSIEGRIVGIPDVQTVSVNDIKVVAGRRPLKGTGEALVDPKFAAAHGLVAGDSVTLYASGKAARVTVSGIATSPEFIYATSDPSDIFPDPRAFGILFMSEYDAASIYGYQGDIDQVLVKYDSGVDTAAVKAAIEKVLDRYGRVASLERKDQFSHAAISQEFEQLKMMSSTLPSIFLLVAAAIMYISVSRMVREQRTQIGVMKAVGYSGGQILSYYTGFGVAGGALGALIGIGLGMLAVPAMIQTYAQYFNLPLGRGRVGLEEIGASLGASLLVSIVAGWFAARGVLTLNPAQSMRPAAPPAAVKAVLEWLPFVWNRLTFSWKMAVRNLTRHKGRAALTVMVSMLAVALIVMALFMKDSADYLFREAFAGRQRHDLAVSMSRPCGRQDLLFLKGIPGVSGVEPFCDYAAKLRNGSKEEDISIKGMPGDSRMQVLADPEQRVVSVPETGLLLDEITARKTGLRPGDIAYVKIVNGKDEEQPVLVRGLVQQLIGGGGFASIEQVNQLAGESETFNGVWLTTDDPDRVRDVLRESPMVISMASPAERLAEFEKMTGMMMFSVGLMTSFGVAMGYSIVYTISSINIEERKREISFMKALGLTSWQAASIVFNENTALSAIGIALGLPLGNVAAKAFLAASGGELWTFPLVIYPRTYLFAALGGYVFVMLAQWAGRRRIRRLDPIAELKTQQE
ncbi:MAG: ABC transporter permease [Ignavibacteriales bacterium]